MGRLALLTQQLSVFKADASRRAVTGGWTLIRSLTSVVCVVGTTLAARRSQECSPNLCKHKSTIRNKALHNNMVSQECSLSNKTQNVAWPPF